MSVQAQDVEILVNAQRLRAGVLLAIVGAAIGAMGSILAGIEMAHVTRKWIAGSGYPASLVARDRMHQAVLASRAARQAAHDAWQANGHFVGSGAQSDS